MGENNSRNTNTNGDNNLIPMNIFIKKYPQLFAMCEAEGPVMTYKKNEKDRIFIGLITNGYISLFFMKDDRELKVLENESSVRMKGVRELVNSQLNKIMK